MMYYACSKCNKKLKIQWHTPGKKIWYSHREFIDLDETNSNNPKYFWCTHCNKPHDLQRDCLIHKAIIIYKGKTGKINSQTSQLSHDDILPQINEHVLRNSNVRNWKQAVRNSNSLPWPCDRDTRLRMPDLIYCAPDSTLRFGYSITNIIEYETETSACEILERSKDYNLSSKIMIQNNAQSHVNLPRIIFLYNRQTDISIDKVKNVVKTLTPEYLDNVFVDYYDEDGEWFEKYFKKI